MSQPAPLPTNLIVGLGATVVLAADLVASKGMLAGVLVGGLAAFGLVVRWRAAPPLVLLATAYLSFFPEGLPAGEPLGRGPVGPNLLDLLTAAAMVAYVAGHYRHLTQTADAGDEPTPDDLAALAIGIAVAVPAGVAVFYLTTALQPDFERGPFHFVRVSAVRPDFGFNERPPHELFFVRSLMLVGLVGGGALLAALVLWLTRLNRLTADEARLLLLDTGWRETRRELARLETWRAAARRPNNHRRRRRIWRSLVAAGLVFVAAFAVFLWALNRR